MHDAYRLTKTTLLTLLAVGIAQMSASAENSPVENVNPLIGTANLDVYAAWNSGIRGHGHAYPGATVPFGMVQLSPDTYGSNISGWDRCSGYHYQDPYISGFTHTHLSGTGGASGGEVRFLPTLLPVDPSSISSTDYTASFLHKNESAKPGYYRALLSPKPNSSGGTGTETILAELTATAHAGIHRYTFHPSSPSQTANIVVSVASPIGDQVVNGASTTIGGFTVQDSQTITGWEISNNWAQGKPTYFFATFSRPFNPNPTVSSDGKTIYLSFATQKGSANQVIVKVGISASSATDAKANLVAEVGNHNFDDIAEAAEDLWSQALARITISGATPDQTTAFYTALYHTLLAPTLYNNADGSYVGMDSKNVSTPARMTTSHPNPGFQYSSTFSLWDIFRAESPLMTIIQPEMVDGWVKSLLTQFQQNGLGELPIWPLAQTETFAMAGHPSVPLIADAYLKGLTSANIDDIWAALTATQSSQLSGFNQYMSNGYVFAGANTSVSTTQDYSFDDWATAAVGVAAKKSQSDYSPYLTRSANWKNVLNSQITSAGWHFSQPKDANGNWAPGFDPTAAEKGDFSEANSWVDTWNVFQDYSGLATAMGGTTPFLAQLDYTFDSNNVLTFKDPGGFPDLTGRVGEYYQGNEPANEIAYIYDTAKVPSKAQAKLRMLMDNMYTLTLTDFDKGTLTSASLQAAENDPELVQNSGIPGNDDCGQLSAWYVLSALGFYSLNPVGGVFYLGTPLFPAAAIDVPVAQTDHTTGTLSFQKKHRFLITAHTSDGRSGPSSTNCYVQSVTLNGAPLNHPYITYTEITAGGHLDFTMGPNPNDAWINGWDGKDPNSGLHP
jgi:predicted alpha-1,2-mannosidase